MNRLYSVNTTAISVHEPPITLVCKSNIVYTSTLQSDVIRVMVDSIRVGIIVFSIISMCMNSRVSLGYCEMGSTNCSTECERLSGDLRLYGLSVRYHWTGIPILLFSNYLNGITIPL